MLEGYRTVYIVTNTINNKQYVGLTCDLEQRKKEHKKCARRGSSTYFHRAIRKYGWDSFSWVTAAKCSDVYAASSCEQVIIRQLETYGNGYNMTTGGEGGWTKTVSEETKEKLAAIMRGKTYEELYGAERAAEIKARQSVAGKGRKRTARTRALLSEANYRRWAEGRPIGKRGNPCEVFGVQYKNCRVAATTLNVSKYTLNKWIQNGKNGARLV